MLRDDVEDRGARHLVGMVEAHAVQHARAAVVAGGIEAREAERRHHLDLVLRHGAERIAGVVLAARRLLGIAVAAQVGGHHGELLGQPRRDLVPGQVRERIAVHQQHRRPLAAVHRDDAGAGGLDLGAGEAFEHATPKCVASTHPLSFQRDGRLIAISARFLAALASSDRDAGLLGDPRIEIASGVMIIGSTPSLASLAPHRRGLQALDGLLVDARDTSRGVCLGTNSPIQKSKSESGKPASSVVGTSGSAAARLTLDTASASELALRG